MEVYILDSLLRRETVVDKFTSLIWTERWNSMGDFELSLPSTLASRSQFIAGVRLTMNLSHRIMTVETVEDSANSEGEMTLTIKGRSLESILEGRVARPALQNTDDQPTWDLTGTPTAIARQMFNLICVTGVIHPNDKLPFLASGNLFPADTIPEPTASIEWVQEPASLYAALTEISEQYDFGFRLLRNYDNSQLQFHIYTGSDRTTSQTNLRPVVFSPDLENLQNTTELTTIEKAKNVAYVFSSEGAVIVYADGVLPEDVTGLDRQVLLVTADAAPEDVTDIPAYLTAKGKAELSKNRGVAMFDGELNQNANYKYQVDYWLGDKVEMRNVDGVITSRRVTEQIFVCDAEGERSYPTLASATFNRTDSWLYQRDKVWSDFADDATWASQA